ncbi:MAG: hypothetical protein ACYTAF_03915 [Planctomycetota bacterium]|jgi:ABC-type transport system involved in multi-copper enzyme maturation permease subunit
MSGLRTIAATTYAETVRRPLYYIVLLAFAFLIFFSQFITLFSFNTELNMIREVGVATLSLWAFIILVVVCGMTVTAELEDRTAVVVLSKPVGRASFLLGKYFGLLGAMFAGMFFLALVLFFTIWMGFGMEKLSTTALSDFVLGGRGVWGFVWETLLGLKCHVVLEGFILSFLQVAVLAALCVSFAAFFPHIFTVASTALIFIIGNMSAYVLGSIEKMEIGVLTFVVRVGTFVFPNFGYFNLQSHFSEGRIISFAYLAAAAGYAVLYAAVVLFLAGSLFERREIR